MVGDATATTGAGWCSFPPLWSTDATSECGSIAAATGDTLVCNVATGCNAVPPKAASNLYASMSPIVVPVSTVSTTDEAGKRSADIEDEAYVCTEGTNDRPDVSNESEDRQGKLRCGMLCRNGGKWKRKWEREWNEPKMKYVGA